MNINKEDLYLKNREIVCSNYNNNGILKTKLNRTKSDFNDNNYCEEDKNYWIMSKL
jgi:hypothetical protein